MSFYTVIQRYNQKTLYWFRASYPFRPLIHSALIDLDETPLYNSKAKKRLSKLDKEFGGKTPALLEKILEHPMISIDELKVLLTPVGPSSPKSFSGGVSQ
ncbi:hypothetical protein Hanom_Chr06g00538211 [Helianthus anomalus]